MPAVEMTKIEMPKHEGVTKPEFQNDKIVVSREHGDESFDAGPFTQVLGGFRL